MCAIFVIFSVFAFILVIHRSVRCRRRVDLNGRERERERERTELQMISVYSGQEERKMRARRELEAFWNQGEEDVAILLPQRGGLLWPRYLRLKHVVYERRDDGMKRRWCTNQDRIQNSATEFCLQCFFPSFLVFSWSILFYHYIILIAAVRVNTLRPVAFV